MVPRLYCFKIIWLSPVECVFCRFPTIFQHIHYRFNEICNTTPIRKLFDGVIRPGSKPVGEIQLKIYNMWKI